MEIPLKNRRTSTADAVSAAEAVAVEALGFLAVDPERFSRFVELSGLEPSNLRAAASQPGFLAGVLDHLGSDESLLVAFAANTGRNPMEVAAACALLGGRDGIETFT